MQLHRVFLKKKHLAGSEYLRSVLEQAEERCCDGRLNAATLVFSVSNL